MTNTKHHHRALHSVAQTRKHLAPPPVVEKLPPPKSTYWLSWWLCVPGLTILIPLLMYLGAAWYYRDASQVDLIAYAGITLFLSVPLLLLATWMGFSRYKFTVLSKRGIRTSGRVCHSRTGWDKYGKVKQLLVIEFWTDTLPKVRYTTKQRRKIALTKGSRFTDFRDTPEAIAPAKKHVEVTYDPQDPRNVHIGSLPTSAVSWGLFICAVFLALVVVIFLWALWMGYHP